MDDTLLVRRAIAGDLDSFGQLYDQYFPRVYDFCWRVLRDADEAAETASDVFLAAARGLPQLARAASFRAWLFAIAQRAVLARADRAGRVPLTVTPLHEEAFGSFDVPDPARVADPAVIGGDHELAALVWEVVTSLSPRDLALLDLHLRQGLDSAEIADVIALNRRDAATLVTRMKAAAADVISSYVVARRGSKDCERLQEVVAPFELPPYSDGARRAVDTHIKGCGTCQSLRARLVPPLDVFGAFAAVQAPVALKGDVWSAIAAGWTARPAAAAAFEPAPYAPQAAAGGGIALGGIGGGSAGGAFPPTAAGGWDRRQVLWFGGAVAGLILFAFIVGFAAVQAIGGGNGGGATGVTRTATASRTASPVVSITPGVAVQSATPNLTPSATAVDTETPTPTPTPVPATPTAPPATPTKAAATPTQAAGTPTPSAATPTKTAGVPKPTAPATPKATPTP